MLHTLHHAPVHHTRRHPPQVRLETWEIVAYLVVIAVFITLLAA